MGTGTTFKFYESTGCGTVEGCAPYVDHYEPPACVTAGTAPTTWGRRKTVYR